MEVILREDVPKLGHRGDLVSVKDGYARNYLLPRKLAMLATPGNRKQLEEMKAATGRRLAKEKGSAEALAEKLGALTLEMERRAGDADQLFGSVTTMDIAEALAARGLRVDRRRIELGQPIKSLGEYPVPIRLHPEVTATLQVRVKREGAPEETAAPMASEEAAEPGPTPAEVQEESPPEPEQD